MAHVPNYSMYTKHKQSTSVAKTSSALLNYWGLINSKPSIKTSYHTAETSI